jgi:transposase
VDQVTTIGLDIAKYVFHAHGADAAGHTLFRKRLVQKKLLEFFAAQGPCVVAMEVCAFALLGASDRQAGAHGAADPACQRQAIRKATEE